jgi:ATP-dependent helicase/nuclease subunit A
MSRKEIALVDGLREEDARARVVAQREFTRPVVVEAGAGTGKTTALVARVLAWSFGPGWDRAVESAAPTAEGVRSGSVAAQVLRGIVAITFTEKAAAEMSERIGGALLEVERGELVDWLEAPEPALPAAELCTRARALRGSLDHLVVQTIHAYCRRLLVENSLDARLHPNLEIDADGRLQEQAVRSAMETSLESAYANSGHPDFLALAARGFGPREIEQALIALLDAGFPSQMLASDPATPERISALIARLREQIEGYAAIADGALLTGGSVTIGTAEFLDWLRATLNEQPPSDRVGFDAFVGQLCERLTDSILNRLKKWRKGDFNKSETAAVGDRAKQLAACIGELVLHFEHVVAIDLDLLDAARSALEAPHAAAEAQLRSAGVLTFSALLGEVRVLLRDRPDVAARIRAGIDQLLVDEFQDTDHCQCEIVRALALEGPEDARPGLFIVGDPKQSIYSWRRADLGAYHAFVEEVCESRGELVRLSVNFRSVPDVLDEVERVIEPVMKPIPGVQPAFERLIASPEHVDAEGFRGDRLRPVEHWLSTGWDGNGDGQRATSTAEAAQIEALALARDLRELHDQHGVAWKSIGVLFRSRGDWEIYLPALRQAGVPYAAEGDRNYYRRREVIDASCLVRCVLDPNDQLALISYLRSVAVGVPDAAWIPLWSRDFPDQFARLDGSDPETIARIADSIRDAARSVAAEVPGIDRIAGWEENLLWAISDIAQLRASFACDSADVFIEKLRTRTLFEATESARYLGAWRCANLERFFREIGLELEAGRDPHELVRRLRAAVATEEIAEEGRPADLMADAVKVMTIHGAKGLGFEHVYLMQLHKGGGGGPERPTQTAEFEGGFEYQLFGVPTLAWDCVLRERERSAEAERVRLLYVAMTRAKQRLVLTGLWPDHRRHSGRGQKGQAIEHLQPRIESTEGLEGWLSGPALDGASDFVDGFGARWLLPDLEAGEAAAPSGTRVNGAELPSESEVCDASHRLAGLRVSAAERMLRPVAAAASARGREGDDPEVFERGGSRDNGAAARAIGSAIHRALEEFDFSADLEEEVERQRDAVARDLAQSTDDNRADETVAAGTQLWDQVARGRLFARLRELSDRIVARELSVLSPPIDDAGPVGYFTGQIDLVYRDPDSDEMVIVDYKTGALGDRDGLRSPEASYVQQGDAYRRALESAFELPYTPRFELWFLRDDEIV